MGINEDLIHLMKNMFSVNFIQGVSDSYVTEPMNQSKGVPQGDKLSLLIFSLFIADLADYLKGNEEEWMIIFYADDLVIVSKTLSTTLQMALERLQKYCTINKLEVNVSNTKSLKFNTGGRLSAKDILIYNGIGIAFVKEFLYLGIVFTPPLRHTAHLAHLKNKVMTSIVFLRQKVNLGKISFNVASRLMEAMMVPTGKCGLPVYEEPSEDWQNIIYQHKKWMYGAFWKTWCNTSRYKSNTLLLHHLDRDDFMNLRGVGSKLRPIIAEVYCNGLHNWICEKTNCYEVDDKPHDFNHGFMLWEECVCKVCGIKMKFWDHVLNCATLNCKTASDLFVLYV